MRVSLKKGGSPISHEICLSLQKKVGEAFDPTHTNVMSCCSAGSYCYIYVYLSKSVIINWLILLIPFRLEILNLSNVYKSFSIVNLFHKLEMSSSLTSFIKHVTYGTQQLDLLYVSQ